MSARQKVPSRQYYNSSCRSFPTPTAGDDGRTGTTRGPIVRRRMRAVHQMTANVDTTPTRPPFWWPLILILLAAGLLRGIFPDCRSALAVNRRHRVARRGRMGPQRPQHGALRRVGSGPVESALPRTSLHRARVPLFRRIRRGHLAGAPGLGVAAACSRSSCSRVGIAPARRPRAGLIAGALLATNYVVVMWNRAALMEATMIAFIVATLDCYVRAQRGRAGVRLAGGAPCSRFFTKAAAAFLRCRPGVRRIAAVLCGRSPGSRDEAQPQSRVATLGGLVVVRRSSRSRCSSCRTGRTIASTTGRCR